MLTPMQIHRHEIPRKFLHVSIGFVTSYLYAKGARSSQIHPVLLAALIPIATADIIRHNYEPFNRFYIRVNGALMRETEVNGYNGVIWYLLGTWIVLRFFPKDIGVMGVLLLSWCDTAASTFGRLWGRYTPRIRKGKSLAGTLAAMIVGAGTALLFWGWLAPTFGEAYGFDTGDQAFAYQGVLSLPSSVKGLLGWGADRGNISGPIALSVMSLWAGFIAGASEAVDLFGWDDNLTIPVLSAAGLLGFLKIFG
jgi:diacylglycerol kinase (CTP)